MKNVKTEKSVKKLDNKFKNFFSVIKIDTHTVMLKLLKTWRIFNTFHTDWVHLKKENLYSEQEEVNKEKTLQKDNEMMIRNNDTEKEHKKWHFEKILNSRMNQQIKKLQYKIQ